MLTATYTLVALSVEQASVRASLTTFQNYVQANLRGQAGLRQGQLDYAFDLLARLNRTCHWRKIETYLIPAIRKATERADQLLEQLSSLNQRTAAILDRIQLQLSEQVIDNDTQVQQLCDAIDSFCALLLERLNKEEHELFPLARTVISGEVWFSIANQILVHDAHKQDSRQGNPPGWTVRRARAPDAPLPSPTTHLVAATPSS